MWTLVENQAELAIGAVHLQLDLSHIERGLTCSIAGNDWSPAQLLAIRLPSPAADRLVPLESYVRGPDLVATYPPLPPFTIQPQVYWRARHVASLSAVGIELIVSVQTSELYSEPQTPISSTIPGTEGALVWAPGDQPGMLAPSSLPRTLSAARGDEGIVACGIPGTGHVYVEMIHPSDLDAMNIELDDGGVRILTQVFEERLEKGVIRRARVCGWFVPAGNWQRRARALYESCRQEPPPLTA